MQDVDHFIAEHDAVMDQRCAILVTLFQDVDAPADAAKTEDLGGILRLVGCIDGRARESDAMGEAFDCRQADSSQCSCRIAAPPGEADLLRHSRFPFAAVPLFIGRMPVLTTGACGGSRYGY